MAQLNKYNDFPEQFVRGVHDFDNHIIKAMLSNTAPNAATHTVRADAGEIAAGNNYTLGGVSVGITVSRTGGTVKIIAADATFTALGGSIGPVRYVILYNDTPTAPDDPLLGWYDYGTSFSITDGNSFTADFDATNGILTLA